MGVSCTLSKGLMSLVVLAVRKVFANKTNSKMTSVDRNVFLITSCKHFESARGSDDLNIDFCSFDNGVKRLCATKFMQEYIIMMN